MQKLTKAETENTTGILLEDAKLLKIENNYPESVKLYFKIKPQNALSFDTPPVPVGQPDVTTIHNNNGDILILNQHYVKELQAHYLNRQPEFILSLAHPYHPRMSSDNAYVDNIKYADLHIGQSYDIKGSALVLYQKHGKYYVPSNQLLACDDTLFIWNSHQSTQLAKAEKHALKYHSDKLKWLIKRFASFIRTVRKDILVKHNHQKALIDSSRYAKYVAGYAEHFSPACFTYPFRSWGWDSLLDEFSPARNRDAETILYDEITGQHLNPRQAFGSHLSQMKKLAITSIFDNNINNYVPRVIQPHDFINKLSIVIMRLAKHDFD